MSEDISFQKDKIKENDQSVVFNVWICKCLAVALKHSAWSDQDMTIWGRSSHTAQDGDYTLMHIVYINMEQELCKRYKRAWETRKGVMGR